MCLESPLLSAMLQLATWGEQIPLPATVGPWSQRSLGHPVTPGPASLWLGHRRSTVINHVLALTGAQPLHPPLQVPAEMTGFSIQTRARADCSMGLVCLESTVAPWWAERSRDACFPNSQLSLKCWPSGRWLQGRAVVMLCWQLSFAVTK
jgi:hypothetical protein